MFERFTDRARRVVALAQREARKLGHDCIGTEHILLGLIDEGAGVATTALTSMGINLDEMRQAVLDSIGRGAEPPPESGHIPFTPGAKKVLELSLREDKRRFPGGHPENWHDWWDAATADPVLAGHVAERARRRVEAGHHESESTLLATHVEALRAAGFAEVGTLWQRGDNRLLCGVMPGETA